MQGNAAARSRFAAAVLAIALAATASGGCYTARMKRMEFMLDSLLVRADSAQGGNTAAFRRLRQDLDEQRETLYSIRAGSNVTSSDLVARLEELSAKLDDTATRLGEPSRPARTYTPPDTAAGGATAAAASGADADYLYEQAARDFTQGRFEMALAGFRELVAGFPGHDLADNGLYGVGESYYALARYDSAATAYEEVEQRYPRGDRVASALYKLGVVYQRQGDADKARATFTRLREKYPRSGEAKLAEERLRELD